MKLCEGHFEAELTRIAREKWGSDEWYANISWSANKWTVKAFNALTGETIEYSGKVLARAYSNCLRDVLLRCR